MGIRSKAALIFAIAALVLFLAVYVVSWFAITRGFAEVESIHAGENVLRAKSVFENMIDELDMKLSDWSQWDDTYAFIVDRNQAYVESNLTDNALGLLKIDAMLFFDGSGNPVHEAHGTEYDLLPEFESLFRNHPEYLAFDDVGGFRNGVALLPTGPVLLAIRPVVTSEGEGPIRGTIVFGRLLDPELVRQLSDITRLKLTFYRVGASGLPPLETQAIDSLIGGQEISVHSYGDGEVEGHVLVRDLSGEPALMLMAEMPRTIYQQGVASTRLFMTLVGIVSVVFAVAMLFLLERGVLSKIVSLHRDIETLRTKGIASVRKVSLPGEDELSALAAAMNELLGMVRSSTGDLRHHAEELRKFELAVEYNFDHIIITDPDGVILYANPAVSRVTGFDTEEIIGKTPALWGGQMDKSFYKRFWKTIKEDKEPFIGEVTNRKKTGEPYLAEARVVPILDDERKDIRFFIGLERDITARRDYERNLLSRNQAIAAEKERSEGILRFLRSIGDGIFAVDRDRRIIFMNDAAERLTKKAFEEVKGREPKEVLPFFLDTDPPTQCPCPLETVIDGGRELSFPDNLFLWGDEGKKVSVSGRASPIRDGSGTVVGCIVVFRDVTERRELEQMKDRFLSVAAHQLRTPLGSMRWNMEMILGGDLGKLPKKAFAAVQDLYANSQRLVTIVNDLLDVSRIDQHRAGEQPEPTDILAVIRDVARTLSPDAASRGVSIVLPETETFRSVTLSPKRFYEAMENLLSNAIKYNRPDGTVTITVGEDEGIVRIAVADTGIGIPEADREKIFAKFFRAENAVHKETDGSGLGLSVVKSFVEEDGGTVRFESEEGKGTTFIVEFPAARSAMAEGEECLVPREDPEKEDPR